MAYTAPPTGFISELADASFLDTYLRDNLTFLNASSGKAPTGLIVLWSGAIASIPTGWHHNDNSGGGIIDLRDKFVVGAGSTYAVGATGGATTGTSTTHPDHSVTQPAHSSHSVTQPDPHGTAPDYSNSTVTRTNFMLATAHANAAVSGAHTHANAAVSAGLHTHDTVSTLPPYQGFAFMQKTAPSGSFTTPVDWSGVTTPTATQLNADFRDNIAYLQSLGLPSQVAIMWSGSVASIPTGWGLCDGSSGTPDLRGVFVVGAGSTYAVGATGGATTAAYANHSSHTVTQADAHGSHSVTSPDFHPTTLVFNGGSFGAPSASPHNHDGADVSSHSSHSGFAVGAHDVHAAFNVSPPYYALAFIAPTGSPFATPKTWLDGEIFQASEWNTYGRDNLTAVLIGLFPIGGIAWWSGSIASIPAGYQLCNGTSGTPDLRNRFVLGAGGAFAVGATGGATSVTPGPHADHTVTQPGNHSAHSVTQPTTHPTVSPVSGGGGSTSAANVSTLAHTGFAVDAHSAHSFSASSHSAHSSVATLPPYYALAYMQRLS